MRLKGADQTYSDYSDADRKRDARRQANLEARARWHIQQAVIAALERHDTGYAFEFLTGLIDEHAKRWRNAILDRPWPLSPLEFQAAMLLPSDRKDAKDRKLP